MNKYSLLINITVITKIFSRYKIKVLLSDRATHKTKEVFIKKKSYKELFNSEKFLYILANDAFRAIYIENYLKEKERKRYLKRLEKIKKFMNKKQLEYFTLSLRAICVHLEVIRENVSSKDILKTFITGETSQFNDDQQVKLYRNILQRHKCYFNDAEIIDWNFREVSQEHWNFVKETFELFLSKFDSGVKLEVEVEENWN